MADGDFTKIGMAAIAAGSIGGFGGHSIGSGGETVVNGSTLEQCQAFIEHARTHAQHQCDIRILQIDCRDKDDANS